MLNIALVENCNLKCAYCFESEFQGSNQIMSIEDFKTILTFLEQEQNKQFSLMGGEPTIHPAFEEILSLCNLFCLKNESSSLLFTNGILLEQYLPKLPSLMGLLINCNSPEDIGEENYRKLKSTLKACYSNINYAYKTLCGVNLYLDRYNYDFIWDIVKEFNLTTLRISTTSPGRKYTDYKKDKVGYFEAMKPIFLKFIQEAIDNNVTLQADCGYIPLCYFTEDEKELINLAFAGEYTTFCYGYRADVFPDLTATLCFSTQKRYLLSDFENVEFLYETLIECEQKPKISQNKSNFDCKKCNLECSGGCFGFC